MMSLGKQNQGGTKIIEKNVKNGSELGMKIWVILLQKIIKSLTKFNFEWEEWLTGRFDGETYCIKGEKGI